MSITENTARVGNFTSSEIVALMSTGKQAEGFGVGAMTYIAKKRKERLLERSITSDVNARPLSWGKLIEPRPFELLGLDYTLTSTETDTHPTIPYWAGSKDGMHESTNQAERAVIDIKCPLTLDSFCDLVMPLYLGYTGNDAMNAIRNGYTDRSGVKWDKHSKAETYYWQLVSNACINGVDKAELIVYMPYLSELPEIRQMAEGEVMWIWGALDNELPYIKDGGFFKNVNVIRFDIPQADKDLLTENVKKAGKVAGFDRDVLILSDKVGDTSVTVIEKVS